MFSLDSFFARIRQWHNSKDSIAFLGYSELALFFLSSSNLAPRAWVTQLDCYQDTHRGPKRRSDRVGDRVVGLPIFSHIHLAVVAACCQKVTILTNDELVSLVVFSRTPFIGSILLTDSCEDGKYASDEENDGKGGGPTEECYRSGLTEPMRIAKCLDDLLRRAHRADCVWRGRRPLQMLFGTDPSLRLSESTVVRARCAAVKVRLVVPSGKAEGASSGGSKPRLRFLLPRATPPGRLGREAQDSVRRLVSPSPPPLSYVGSNTNERILNLFFPSRPSKGGKRDREEGGRGPTAAADSPLSESGFQELSANRLRGVCLLLHLHGYILEGQGEMSAPLPSIVGRDTVEALEGFLAATDWDGTEQELGGTSNEDATEKDQMNGEKESTEQLHTLLGGWHFRCSFCAGKPPVRIDRITLPEPEDSVQTPSKTVQECTSEPIQPDESPAQPAGEDETKRDRENGCAGEVQDTHSHDSEDANSASNEDHQDPSGDESKGENPAEVDVVDPAHECSIQTEQDCNGHSPTPEAIENVSYRPPFTPKQRHPSIITVSLSAREPLNGHRDWCPWKNLFLDVVLKGQSGGGEGDDAQVIPPRLVYMDFSVSNSSEGGKGSFVSEEHSAKLSLPSSGEASECSRDHDAGEPEPPKKIDDGAKKEHVKDTLRFQLTFTEIERLITVWRTSEDIERRFRYSYLVNPFPEKVWRLSRRQFLPSAEAGDAVSSVVEGSSSPVAMEAFLANLQKRLDTVGNGAGAGLEGSYRAASVVYWPTMMTETASSGGGIGEKTLTLVADTIQTLLGAENSTKGLSSVDLAEDSATDCKIGTRPTTSTTPPLDTTGSHFTPLLAEGLMLLKKMSASAIPPSHTGSAADASSKRQDLAKQCADFIERMDRKCLPKICPIMDTKDGVAGRDRIVFDVLQKLVKPTIALLYHDHLFPVETIEGLSKPTAPTTTSSVEAAEAGVGVGVGIDDSAKEPEVKPQTSLLSSTGGGVASSGGSSSLGWFWSSTSLADARGSVETFLNELRQRQHPQNAKVTHEPQQPSSKVSRLSPQIASSVGPTIQQRSLSPSKPPSFQDATRFLNAPNSSSTYHSESLEPHEHRGARRSAALTSRSPALDPPDGFSASPSVFTNPVASPDWRGFPMLPKEPLLPSTWDRSTAILPSGASHPTPSSSTDTSVLGSVRFQKKQSRWGPQASHHELPYQPFRPRRPLSPSKVVFSSPPMPQESFAFAHPSNVNEFQPPFTRVTEGRYPTNSGGVGMGTHKSDSGIFPTSDNDPNTAPPSMQDPFSSSHLSSGPHAHMLSFADPGNEPYYQSSARYPPGLYSQGNQGILDGDPNIATLQSEKQQSSQPHRPRRGGGVAGGRRRRGGGGGRGGRVRRGS
ncbi:unnamed protein product [Phytomonas sp. EM1]|nr:unnamed protein product [Phytomonas sp. EM1]|eukprot:CCW60904.1 unnamed protein product [Phytomonas sp. isolate EM1]